MAQQRGRMRAPAQSQVSRHGRPESNQAPGPKLFIRGRDLTKEMLRPLLDEYGDYGFHPFPPDDKFVNYALVNYSSTSVAQAALEGLKSKYPHITVKFAEKQPRSGRDKEGELLLSDSSSSLDTSNECSATNERQFNSDRKGTASTGVKTNGPNGAMHSAREPMNKLNNPQSRLVLEFPRIGMIHGTCSSRSCGKLAALSCKVCAAWYCNMSCYVEDFSHSKTCRPMVYQLLEDGRLLRVNDPRNTPVSSDSGQEFAHKSKLNYSEAHNTSGYRGGPSPVPRTNSQPKEQDISPRTGKFNESDHATTPFNRQTSPRNNSAQNEHDSLKQNRGKMNESGDATFNKLTSPRNVSRNEPDFSVRSSLEKKMNESGDAPAPFNKLTSPRNVSRNEPDFPMRTSLGKANESSDDPVPFNKFTSPRSSPREKLELGTRHEVGFSSEEIDIQRFPIPTDAFTEVVVKTCFGPNAYVLPLEKLMEAFKMESSLKKICARSDSIQSAIIGGVYGCLNDSQDWCRVKVLSSGKKATVLYIDHGIQMEVDVSKLKPLPNDLAEKPALSFKIKLMSQRTLAEKDILEIKPIRYEAKENVWFVQANPSDSPEIQDVPSIQTKSPQLAAAVPKKIISDSKETPRAAPPEDLVTTPDVPDPFETLAKFTECQIVHVESPDVFWVQTNDSVAELCEFNEKLKEYSEVLVRIPSLGQIYTILFEGIWCRAKVTKIEPLTVHYIDYGNSESVKLSELHPLSTANRLVPPMAIKVKLADGTPTQLLELYKYITLQATRQLSDGAVVCQVEGVKYSELKKTICPIERKVNHVVHCTVATDKASVLVHQVMSNDCLNGTMITEDPDNGFYLKNEDMFSVWEEEAQHLTPETPSVGDNVMVKIRGKWFRGCVVDVGISIRVGLVDYGIVVTAHETVPMPKSVEQYAQAAVRLIFANPSDCRQAQCLGDTLELSDITKENGKLTCTVGTFGEAEVIPWAPLIEETDLPIVPIESGGLVSIASYETPDCVYVSSVAKEHEREFVSLQRKLETYAKEGIVLPLKERPLCGQMVLKLFANDYHRAKVLMRKKASFRLIYVDYGNTESARLNDLLPLPDQYKKVPSFAVKIGLEGLVAPSFNTVAINYLNTLIETGETFKCKYDGSLEKVTLVTTSEGISLNDRLIQMMAESWKPNPSKEHRIMAFTNKQIRYESWGEGKTVGALIVQVIAYNVLLVVLDKSAAYNHMLSHLTPAIQQHCKRLDPDDKYVPREKEVVLAKFDDDNEWYRALCEEVNGSQIKVRYIDYDNRADVDPSNIRPIQPEFMEPLVGVKKCRIFGLPPKKKLTSEQQELFMKYFIEVSAEVAVKMTVVKDFGEEVVVQVLDYKPPTIPGLATAQPFYL